MYQIKRKIKQGFIPLSKFKYPKRSVVNMHFSSAGFTLIETLVVIFVFSIMALIAAGILVKAMEIERKSFASQAIQENVLSVLELMAKEIRVSTISDQDNNCSVAASPTLTVVHPINGSTTYSITGGAITKTNAGTIYYLNSPDVTFTGLGFCISGTTSPADNKAARITIILSVQSSGGSQGVSANIQTTVTSRSVIDEFEN